MELKIEGKILIRHTLLTGKTKKRVFFLLKLQYPRKFPSRFSSLVSREGITS